MTKLLLKRITGEDDSKDDPKYRAKVGRLSGIVGIISNAVLFVLKILVGLLSGSVSITADAMNNLSDATSSIVTLLGFRLAEIPPDENHPYGHARFEYLSGLAVAAMILIIGFKLLETSVGKIVHPSPTEFSIPVLIVLLGSILVKLWLARFNTVLAKEIESSTIMATATDSRNDVFSTTAVLIASVVEFLTSWQIDGIMGLVVALFIIKSGIELGIETISPLLGEAANPELSRAIETLVKESPMVLGIHDLMVHDYGPSQRFASLHVEMDSSIDPLESHEEIDDLERECYEKLNVHLVIHYDPVIVGDPEIDRMKMRTLRVLKAIDERLTLHDFRMVKGDGHTNIIFDVPLPFDMRGEEETIIERVEETLSNKNVGRIFAVVTFDQMAQ